jgi:hypothetical protein
VTFQINSFGQSHKNLFQHASSTIHTAREFNDYEESAKPEQYTHMSAMNLYSSVINAVSVI